jgi:hypothetical protein
MVELERHGLDPARAGSVQLDQPEQPEVVAKDRVDAVIVDEVAEVVEDPAVDPVEDVAWVLPDRWRRSLPNTR